MERAGVSGLDAASLLNAYGIENEDEITYGEFIAAVLDGWTGYRWTAMATGHGVDGPDAGRSVDRYLAEVDASIPLYLSPPSLRGDAPVSPDATEVCNGIDDDCDDRVDDADDSLDTSTGVEAYVDADGDGHGDPEQPMVRVCAVGEGTAAVADDCDDSTDCTDCGVRGDREDECETKCGSDPTCFAYDVSTDGTSFLCHTYHVPIPGTMNGCSDQTIPPACFIRLDLLPPSAPPSLPSPPPPATRRCCCFAATASWPCTSSGSVSPRASAC